MIFSPFERIVALRYLGARREEGFLSVIAAFSFAGIALGVATLIVVMSVMNGFRAEMLNRILALNGHLSVYPGQVGALDDHAAVAERIRAVTGVVRVTPIVQEQVLATVKGRTARGALVRGMPVDDVRSRAIIADNIRAGSLDAFKGRNTIIVGARFADNFGLKPGSRVRLISQRSKATAFGSVPRNKTFRVAAVFEVGMFDYDSGIVYMPIEAAQRFLGIGKRVSSLEVALDDADRVEEMRDPIFAAAKAVVRLLDWEQINGAFFGIVKVQRNVLSLILALIVVVAALNIISGLVMLVKDKGRDIAILRTMGATRGMIMRIFVLAGSTVGVVGTVVGFLLGIAFALNIESIRRWLEELTGAELFSPKIYYLSRLPTRIEADDVIGVVLLSLALSLLATLYPAWRAARLDPVEALRYE